STTYTENYTAPYSATVIFVDCESIAWTPARGAKQVGLHSIRCTLYSRYSVQNHGLLRKNSENQIHIWSFSNLDVSTNLSGVYKFPFLFMLPLNCAPSFEGFYGYIRYMVKVVLDRPWRFNKTDKRLFTGSYFLNSQLDTVPSCWTPQIWVINLHKCVMNVFACIISPCITDTSYIVDFTHIMTAFLFCIIHYICIPVWKGGCTAWVEATCSRYMVFGLILRLRHTLHLAEVNNLVLDVCDVGNSGLIHR
ncbi:unnamed protein product, partial [Angiostrongylus costaricensis]|uniref:Arrestin_N domain-containing protein n=1 Tax=Angiostrongylus costaricensis TaxID=334426 RepID=A0A0R3PST3_ANGCS